MATSPDRPVAQTFPVRPGGTFESGPVTAASPEDANRSLLPSEVGNAADAAQQASNSLNADISALTSEQQKLTLNFAAQQEVLNSWLAVKKDNPDYPGVDNLISTTLTRLNETQQSLTSTDTLLADYRTRLGLQDVAPAVIQPRSVTSSNEISASGQTSNVFVTSTPATDDTSTRSTANSALLSSEVTSASSSSRQASNSLNADISSLTVEQQNLTNNFAEQQKILNSWLAVKNDNPDYPGVDNIISTIKIRLNETQQSLVNTDTLLADYRSRLGFQDVAPAVLQPQTATSSNEIPGSEAGQTSSGLGNVFVLVSPAVDTTSTRPVTETPAAVVEQPRALETSSVNDTAPTESTGVYTTPPPADPNANVAYNNSPSVSNQEAAILSNQASTETQQPTTATTLQDVLSGSDPGILSDEVTLTEEDILFAPTSAAGETTASPSTTSEMSASLVTSAVTDWRFRISLAPDAKYLYATASSLSESILFPLKATSGVIFPYTPKIDVTYNANYDSSDITHTNYKFYNYRNSSVDNISISGDFTAQDTSEANYVLAVIHFFRSVTKMWYGNDSNPRAGTPPPLVYLTGHGSYAFNMHPVVITSFSLSYPTDVDYINAGVLSGQGRSIPQYRRPVVGRPSTLDRLRNSNLPPNGNRSANMAYNLSGSVDTSAATRVPTKLTLSLTALPVVTRNTISNRFSLQDYATGKLLRGNIEKGNGGGIW